MHKRSSIQKDSIRLAKVTQSALDAIDVRIEKEKSRRIRHVNYAKIRMWNELKSIHKVFVPQYVPNSDKDKSTINVNKTSVVGQEPDEKLTKLPQSHLPKRIIPSSSSLPKENVSGQSRGSLLEAKSLSGKVKLEQKRSCVFQPAYVDDEDSEGHSYRKRSGTWPLGINRTPAREETRANSQDYVNKLLQINVEPCVSAPMSAVTNGYLVFKRLLRRRQSAATTETQYVSSRYRADPLEDDSGEVASTLVSPDKCQARSKEPNLSTIAEDAKDKIWLPSNSCLGSRKTAIPVLKNNFISASEGVAAKVVPFEDGRRSSRLAGSMSMPEEPRRRMQSLVASSENSASRRPSRYLPNSPQPKRNHKENSAVVSAVSFILDEESSHVKRPTLRPRALSDSAAFQTRGQLAPARLSPVGMLSSRGFSSLSPRKANVASKHAVNNVFVPKVDRHVKVVKFSDSHKKIAQTANLKGIGEKELGCGLYKTNSA